MKKTIIVTGAGGYIGTSLVPSLLKSGYKVRAIDRYFFGEEYLKKHPDLKIIKEDIRNLNNKHFKGAYAIIDLAAISNDVTGERFAKETYEINFKSRFRNAELAKLNKVKKYILPSSASNYGKIKNNEIADENFKLKPLTNYSKANALAEKNILKLSSKSFCTVVLRQGTVYGYSPKMRFDLVINRMTYEAWKNKRIYLMKDGTQRRPTLHIKDAINAMKYMLGQKSNKINKHIFNVGCDGNNLEMVQIANMVNAQFKNKFKIKWYGSKDFRSYFVSFNKIKNLGFKGKYKPSDGMKEIIKKLESKKIDLNEKTITLDWYEKIENWKRIIDNISINDKLLKK